MTLKAGKLLVGEPLSSVAGLWTPATGRVIPAWDPTAYTQCICWLDSADPNTIRASSSNTLVEHWADKSGYGNHVANIASKQPTTGTDTINGMNVLKFAGAQLLQRTNMWTDKTGVGTFGQVAQPVTILIVFKSSDTTNNNLQMIGNASGEHTTMNQDSGHWVFYAGGSEPSTGIALDTNAHVYAVMFNGASSKWWLDGSSGTGSPGTNSLNSLNVGAPNGGGSNNFKGDMAEVAVFNGDMQAAVPTMITAVRAKWNI